MQQTNEPLSFVATPMAAVRILSGVRRCRKNPEHLIEPSRPKWAAYCELCGRHRSRDWKREHPEWTKAVFPEEKAAVAERVREWRKRNSERAKELNRKHAKAYRERRKMRSAAVSAEQIPAAETKTQLRKEAA